jgi:MFS family permease
MLLSLFATTPLAFYAVFALIGASSGVQTTTTLNLVVEFAQPTERVTYLGLHGSLIAPAVLIAPLLGGWLAEVAGYGPLFTIAAVSTLGALVVLSLMVRDPRHRQEAPATTA